MSDTVSIQVTLDPEDLAEDLLNAGGFDISKFILHIDEQIADFGFTIDLVVKLLGPMLEESEKYTQYLGSKALEQNFGDPAEHLATWPHPSHPMHSRSYAEDFEEEGKRTEVLREAIKLLGSLVE